MTADLGTEGHDLRLRRRGERPAEGVLAVPKVGHRPAFDLHAPVVIDAVVDGRAEEADVPLLHALERVAQVGPADADVVGLRRLAVRGGCGQQRTDQTDEENACASQWGETFWERLTRPE